MRRVTRTHSAATEVVSTPENPAADRIGERIRAALESADLEAFADLLDPQVHWGAPGDGDPPCQNREQVLRWYRRGRGAGRRAHVTDLVTHGDKILVTLTVTAPAEEPESATTQTTRWQVLTVAGGRVVDIRGYDDAVEAAQAANQPRSQH